MANRITELFQELAENVGNQQQFQIDQQLEQQEAERELYDTPEARRALEIAGILGLVALPIPGSNTLAARLGLAQAGKPLINKSYGAVGGDMVSQTLKEIERRAIGQSGARVNTDVAGRVLLPKIKDPVVTKQGPRGPINIDSPKQLPLKGLEDARYTKGLSETDQEMIKRLLIPPLTKTGQRGIPATKAARETQVEIKKLERWKRSHEAKVRRGEAEYQEGIRSGYEPDIKGGGKMMRESTKRIQEIQAELDELYKKL
jgi:hypothetical protein